MTSTSPPRGAASGRRFPRWLLVLGAPIAAFLLIGFFVFLRFPFDRFQGSVATSASQMLGAQVEIGRLDPAFTLGGPGFEARDVRIRWPDGHKALVSKATLRPAWSLSWLAGTPSFHLHAESDLGGVDGAFVIGDAPRFGGRLEAVELGRLPLASMLRGADLDGRLDLDGDLELTPKGLIGEARFESRDGSIAAQQLPVAMPYERLDGEVRFNEDGSIELIGVELEGPMVSARIEGGTGPSPTVFLAPLEIDVRLEVRDPNLRPAMQATGIRLEADGTADLRIRGNMTAPEIR